MAGWCGTSDAPASGGGVAEMLKVLVAYGRVAGADTRWLVLDGDAEFFAITKRLHNFLHGSTGDGGRLDDRARTHYQEVLALHVAVLVGTSPHVRHGARPEDGPWRRTRPGEPDDRWPTRP